MYQNITIRNKISMIYNDFKIINGNIFILGKYNYIRFYNLFLLQRYGNILFIIFSLYISSRPISLLFETENVIK